MHDTYSRFSRFRQREIRPPKTQIASRPVDGLDMTPWRFA
jgi:hypothetical protein